MISNMRRSIIKNRFGMGNGIRRNSKYNPLNIEEFENIIKKSNEVDDFLKECLKYENKYHNSKLVRINDLLINSKKNVFQLSKRNGLDYSTIYFNYFTKRLLQFLFFVITIILWIRFDYIAEMFDKDYNKKKIAYFEERQRTEFHRRARSWYD